MRNEIKFVVSPKQGQVSALVEIPNNPEALLLLAHGAGTDMRHFFLENLCLELANHQIATFRYNFPYKEKGKGGPNSAKILKETVQSAIKRGNEILPKLPHFVGGKSMGGRRTSLTIAEEAPPMVKGILFFGFPLHAAGKPGIERADHLSDIRLPMLFLQGPRDTLAKQELISSVVNKLGNSSSLHMVGGADHSFKVLKRSERKEEDVMRELAEVSSGWMKKQA